MINLDLIRKIIKGRILLNKMLSVIMPVYNEHNIYKNTVRVMNILNEAAIKFEIVLVDDGSEYDVWHEIEKLTEDYKTVSAISFSRNFGKENALCAGMEAVRGDCCVCIDSDLQHPPELIPEMYRLWSDDGYEVIEGVKKKRPKEGILYRFCSRFFYFVLKRMTKMDMQNSSDFRLLDRSAVEAWRALPEKQTFFRGMSSWIGFKRTQIYFEVADREEGKSKWSLSGLFSLAINAVTSYSATPLYVSASLGIIFLLLFVVMFIQTLYMKFSGYAQDGFTTIIILQLIIGSILMISLGIIGIYIEKIYEEVKGRPRYIIKRKIDNGANAEKNDKE